MELLGAWGCTLSWIAITLHLGAFGAELYRDKAAHWGLRAAYELYKIAPWGFHAQLACLNE